MKFLPTSALIFCLGSGLMSGCSPSGEPQMVAQAPVATLPPADALQCATDLCGSPENSRAYWLSGPFAELAPESTKQFQQKEVGPLLERAFGDVRQIRQVEIEAMNDLLLRQNELDLAQFDLSLLILAAGQVIVEPIKDKITADASERAVVLLKKLIPLRPEIDPTLLKVIVDARNNYITSPEFGRADLAQKSNFEDFLIQIFNRSRLSASLKKDYLEGRFELLAKESKFLGRLAYDGLHPELLLRNPTKRPFTVAEEGEVMKLIAMSYRFEAARLDLVKSKVSTVRVTAAELFRIIDLEGKIRALESREQEWTHGPVSPEFADFRTKFEARAGKFLAAAPSEFRIKKTLEMYEVVRASAKRVLPNFFQGAALQAANEAVSLVTIETPPSLSDIEARLRGTLESRGNAIDLRKDLLTKTRANLTNAEKIFLLTSILVRSAETKIDSELNTMYSSMRISAFEDRAYPAEKEMVISWQTSIFPEVASGNMAHETGHIVSHAVSALKEGKNPYEKKIECSVVRNFHLLKKKIKTAQYSEEDWADDFAVAVHLDLKKSENYSCGMLKVDPETQRYANLSFDPPTADVHSTSLLRTLRTHLGLGKQIPESCRAILGEAFTKIENDGCQ